MLKIDAHCDTITKLMDFGGNLLKNEYQLDIKRLAKKGEYVQFFAAFIHPRYCQAYAMKRAVQIIDKMYEQFDIYRNRIALCCSSDDIHLTHAEGKIAAVISIEGGEALQGDLSALRMFYRLGVRSICLTWNNRNEIADGAADASTGGGLTPFGKTVVSEMNRLGMLIDVSHIGEKGFWDVIETTSSPIIASHANARAVCDHRRNLTDRQIKAIEKNGGVMGMYFYPPHVNSAGKASLSDVIRHIEHIAALVGDEHIGIGSDFDGDIDATKCVLDRMGGVEDLDNLFNELLKLNYSEESVRKIAGGNFMRVIKQVLK